MWHLTSESDQRILYVLPNQEITIGRSIDAQVCNFAIPEDASISRKHATLLISKGGLYIQDMGSRYGTFINNFSEKIESNSQIKLKNNDIIRFGKINSVWKVNESRFVTCTSTLKGENLHNLKQCLNILGGELKAEWDDSCVYLTMPAITLTIKVVLALAQGAHIVTTDFWSKSVETVKTQTPLPDPTNFIPLVVESTLNKENVSFLPNEKRKSLFAGKTIIFFSRKQLEMYKTALLKCSANPLLLSETKMTKSSLCEENVIVIQNASTSSQETEAQRSQINDILTYIKSKGKRVIADAEIGLSILYCSTDKYCNPDFNFSSEVIKQVPPATKPANVLAQETQEQTQKLCSDNVVINETLTPTTSKRKLNEDDEHDLKANKKFASERAPVADLNNESVKRKHNDEGNDNENPNKKRALGSEDEDMFNFLNNTTQQQNNENNSEKLLNFTKPTQKAQNSATNDEEDLFNFVQDKSKENGTLPKKMFNVDMVKKEVDAENQQGQKRKLEDETVDISAMRGAKLKELMENQSNWSLENYANVKIKKEDPDDLDRKMNDLDLGTTILRVRNNLIVKKEPIVIEDLENEGRHKNFKKFKKVWPVKMQVTVVPKSTMSILIPDSVAEEITSQSY